MASLSANGCHEIARTVRTGGAQYALRSDGVILVKWIPGDGWSTTAKVNVPKGPEYYAARLAAFREFASDRGLRVEVASR